MLNSMIFEILENLNILFNLALKGSMNFPHELCRFLQDELNLRGIFIAEERSENQFFIISNSSANDEFTLNSLLEIDKYNEVLESEKFNDKEINECRFLNISQEDNQVNFVLNTRDKKRYVLGVNTRIPVSSNQKEKLLYLGKFIRDHLTLWKENTSSQNINNELDNSNLLNKVAKGLIREIKTTNGLLTLIKEERLSIEVENYINEIKTQNTKVLSSINELLKLTECENNGNTGNEAEINFSQLTESILKKFSEKNNEVNITLNDSVENKILINENVLSNILFQIFQFFIDIAGKNQISVLSEIKNKKGLRITIKTKSLNLSQQKLDLLTEPFGAADISQNHGALTLTLLSKYIELLNGSMKFTDDQSWFQLHISIPVVFGNIENNRAKDVQDIKPKILVIESDSASSLLLKNHLKKWDYSTEIVQTGSQAIRKLTEDKFVAVILNIEQDTENALMILQQVKNNKLTRNTPIIVLSIEADSEKVYLLGSVDYLVKPINYNNLIEILTSYKLRRNSTVLCVDDDKPTLNLINQAVRTAGFNALSFYRPELVIESISDKDIDLAIIDLDMPIMDGFDLILEIKSLEKFSKLPIIIYTGQEDYHKNLIKIDGMFVDLLKKRSTSINELENRITDMIKSYEQPLKPDENLDSSNGPKILMAEDYKHSQIIVTRLLKKSGFENIIVVENGEEALNICENDKIDLILMDMQMPVMNGFEATGKIRKLPGYADTPIISLTAFAMKGDREKCLEAGATDYIPKPIDSKEFIEKVKYYTQVAVSE